MEQEQELTRLERQFNELLTELSQVGAETNSPTPVGQVLITQGADGIHTLVDGCMKVVNQMGMIAMAAGLQPHEALPNIIRTTLEAAVVTAFEIGLEYQRRGWVLPEFEAAEA